MFAICCAYKYLWFYVHMSEIHIGAHMYKWEF